MKKKILPILLLAIVYAVSSYALIQLLIQYIEPVLAFVAPILGADASQVDQLTSAFEDVSNMQIQMPIIITILLSLLTSWLIVGITNIKKAFPRTLMRLFLGLLFLFTNTVILFLLTRYDSGILVHILYFALNK
jgi:hypothetical protein